MVDKPMEATDDERACNRGTEGCEGRDGMSDKAGHSLADPLRTPGPLTTAHDEMKVGSRMGEMDGTTCSQVVTCVQRSPLLSAWGQRYLALGLAATSCL